MIRNVPHPGGFLSLFRRAFLLFGFVLLAASPGFAQDPVMPALAAEAKSLTQALVALNARYQLAGPAERSQLLDELERVAAERQQLLASFIQDHSDEVLRLAVPQGLRSSLPDQVQAYLEEQQTVEGELEVLHVDHKDPRKSHYRYFLTTPSGKRFSLHFVANPPGLLSGAKVRVRGPFLKRAGPADLSETAGAMAVPDGVTNVETLAAGGTSGSTSTTSASTTVLPSTFGAQKTLVILVNFQDKATQPYTPDTARNIVFNTTSNFDLENSFQQAWLTGDVYGWYTIALDSTVCDSRQIARYAKQAATAAGVNLSAYTRYVYAFPDNACGWWGLGTVGGNPSQAWINGSLGLKGVGHAMGHNFGLYHSHGLECGRTTFGSNCTTIEYGDTLDKMGDRAAGHFNAFQKERLGWLNYASSPPILTVQADGTYWLEPYETGPGVDPKALKILKSVDPTTGTKTWYYVEYRQAVGFDSFLSSNGNVLNGVVVHIGTENSGNSSDLLDMTPATSSWNDPALEIGQSFYDPDAGVTIAPTWANGSNAQVSVSIGPVGCAPTNPALALSPPQSQWVQAGATVTYTVTLTNKDNARCSKSSFDLLASVPSGWTAAFASPMLTLDPGASASTTLTVTSSASAADGFYPIPVGATNGADMSYTASASATLVIAASLDVVVPTNQPTYTPNQSVTPTTQVYGNGSPVPNSAASTRSATVAVTTVTISPGSSIQAAINANPAGTVFTLPSGTWNNQKLTPKVGNQFIGDPAGGTILDGNDVTSTIYSSNGTVNLNVVWKNIVVEDYGINAVDCYLGAIHGVAGWTFENATFRFNNCTGLNVGPDNKVIGGKFNDNGHAGIQGYKPHRTLVQGAEIARNNTRRDNPEWDAAGLKLADADAVILRNNYAHDNYGPGLWCDINCRNMLIEGNTVIGNYAQGIHYEVSVGNTIIRNNVANDNGVTLLGRPQIFVSSSNGVEVYGNNVRASGVAGSILMQADKNDGILGAPRLVTANNSIHHNTVTITSNSSRASFANFGGSVGTGNSSNNNAFYVLNTSHPHFYWNTSFGSNWTTYRSASGQDANSTIQVGNASVPGNTQGCPALTGCGGTSDTTPPTVSLTAPANGSTVSGSAVAVSANASDNVGVTSVAFKVDSTTLFTDTASPYAMTWNTTSATNGSHALTAVASDAAGNTTTSSAATVTVSNGVPTSGPTVASSIANGSTVSGSLMWTATASPPPGTTISKIEFFIDNVLKWTEGIAPYQYNGDPSGVLATTTLTNGSHTLMVKATASNTTTGVVTATVTVSNGATPSGPGRIAVSSDGNWHDPDDISASALTIALLSKTGNAGKLTFYGHSDHFWYSPDANREEQMRVSVIETAKRFGGFDISKMYNLTQQKSAAISALAAEINKSSATDRLFLIAAGPMEFVGQAISASDPAKRQYVTVISHSAWNDNHAQDDKNAGSTGSASITGWQWSELGSLGVALKHIKDQNGGLQNPYSSWYWLRDSTDANLRWLWCRSQNPKCPEFSGFAAGAGLSTFDVSDAGMMYWLLTGGMSGGGDEDGNPTKVKAMLESSTPLPDTTPPSASLTAPASGSTVSGSAVTVSANASDNVGVTSVAFKVDGTTLFTDTASPYAMTWNTTTATNASHSLTAVASDAAGHTTTSSSVIVTVNNTTPSTQSPYDGTPRTIPGTIQAEDYDNGGEGIAYHDTDTTNSGGAYRTNGVDIKTSSDTPTSPAIGWVNAGEWWEYTVNVSTAGTYTLEARVASAATGKSFHVEIDGVDKTGPMTVPNTAPWDTAWATVTKTGVSLTAGSHVMRIFADTDLFDINFVKFVALPDTTPPTVSITAPANGSTVSGSAVTVSANASDNVGVTSVAFKVDGTTLFTNTASPYTMTWNTTSATNASHTLTAVASDAAGHTTTSSSVIVTVNNAPVLQVSSLTLINADTDKDIGPIQNGATIDLGTLPTRNLNVRANTSPATVGSVVFTGVVTRTESVAPYALAGDNGGNYNTWTPSPGALTITATPYSSSGGNGTKGQALAVNFTVK